MHQLPFTLKRAHHATLKLLRPFAARHDLTPARFDLLYVLHVKGGMVEPYQFRIAEVLGLCRSTVCKMIKAMEKIGLVKVGSDDLVLDGRRRRVRLTRYGRHCFRQTLKAIRRREIERPLLKAVSFWNCNTYNKRFDFVVGVCNNVRRVLMGLGDQAEDRLYGEPASTELQKIGRRPQPRPTLNFRARSYEWFLLNGFLCN